MNLSGDTKHSSLAPDPKRHAANMRMAATKRQANMAVIKRAATKRQAGPDRKWLVASHLPARDPNNS